MPKACVSPRRKVRGGSVLSWIKDKALPWIKNNKLVSRGAAALGGILPGGFATAAKAISTGANAMGWVEGESTEVVLWQPSEKPMISLKSIV